MTANASDVLQAAQPVLQSGQSTVGTQADSRGQFRRIVIKFKFAYTQHFVITTRLGFKTFTANMVFGHPSNSSILLRTGDGSPLRPIYSSADLNNLEPAACGSQWLMGVPGTQKLGDPTHRAPIAVFDIMHANVKGLLTHFDKVEAYLHLNFKHVVAITESKLSAADGDASVAVDGYDLVRHDRVGRRGGRVADYIHKSICSKILATSEIRDDTSPEYVVLEISSDRDKLQFEVVY
ncbi:hypothetical protein TSAR_012461 [Trichomalopsis sarcophagae]|uniref:Uncharacterized protein n=1 Tax=Trichomalopsis sarcophagae TaxID=543379 RepID=A0A232FFL8_9HYME|nr:hypothetical protein TSAR_012461 [Trichomalopsis sarcophagae]